MCHAPCREGCREARDDLLSCDDLLACQKLLSSHDLGLAFMCLHVRSCFGLDSLVGMSHTPCRESFGRCQGALAQCYVFDVLRGPCCVCGVLRGPCPVLCV